MNITDLMQNGNYANEQDSGYYEYLEEQEQLEQWLFSINEIPQD